MDFVRQKLQGVWAYTPTAGGHNYRVEIFQSENVGSFSYRISEQQADGNFQFKGGASPQKTLEESLSAAEKAMKQMFDEKNTAST